MRFLFPILGLPLVFSPVSAVEVRFSLPAGSVLWVIAEGEYTFKRPQTAYSFRMTSSGQDAKKQEMALR